MRNEIIIVQEQDNSLEISKIVYNLKNISIISNSKEIDK